MNMGNLQKLQQQASLQFKARETGQRCYELLPPDPDGIRGFARLPRPDAGDLFFDMEGDPFEPGGLEYLFGLYYIENGAAQFKAFWAHSREVEEVRTNEEGCVLNLNDPETMNRAFGGAD